MSAGEASPCGWIGRGVARHERLRPTRHRFEYPTWFVLLPLRALAQGAACALPRNRRAVASFWDRDHGDGGDDCLAWIDALLTREGIADAHGEVWLHTYPRVLGYVFKPVSFWYCERRDGSLAAIVAEVNNTFGERHAYLLDGPRGRALRSGEDLRATKVFHVSPFCGVAGEYRFRFFDDARRGLARIDYDDDDGRSVLTTSLSGRYAPLGPRSVARALLAYPAFTFGVIARIHWQALRLWLRRVPLHPKPPPPPISVSRGPR